MEMQKKYGLSMAICMVVGTVIGSGVFFKAQNILQNTGGDMMLGVLAWLIGGSIMLACALTFANMATKYEKVNGLIDYAEAMVGPRYAYGIGWFMTFIYSPSLTGVLAWLSARYTLTFLVSVNPDLMLHVGSEVGGELFSPECLALTMVFLCAAYALNALSPKLAGIFQISTTVIKLIPLILMAVVGTIYGLSHGMTQQNFMFSAATTSAETYSSSHALFMAVVATAFAYEGWIFATSINAEIRDAKRNLPLALIIGAAIVITTYVAYFIGVAGGASVTELMDDGATTAFVNIFGNVFGNFLNLMIAISCMGTLNGLMMGACRGLYGLASRGTGPKPQLFATVDAQTNMPTNSAVVGLMMSAIWGAYFFYANLSAAPNSWVGSFVFDSSELPIITLYAMYIPIFLMFIKKNDEGNAFTRVVLPLLASIGSAFMILACIISHGMANVYYLIVFAVVMGISVFFYKNK